jgi:tetratricopeptide (TPR) repeat protein
MRLFENGWRHSMKKTCVFFGIFIFALTFLSPQDYKGRARIRGKVTDQSGRPIEGVKVKLVYTKISDGFEVVTDSDGIWIASWLKGGAWNIDFEKIGYLPKKISITVKEGSRNSDIGIELEKMENLSSSDELREVLDRANGLFKEGKLEESIQAYEDILAKFPDAYIIHAEIGNVYFNMKNYAQAIKSYQKALENDPGNNELKIYIGNCYSNQGDSKQAQEWYSKVEFEQINDVNVLYNIGSDFYSQSNFEQALAYYKRAVELKEDFLEAIYYLGLTYLSLGRNQEALSWFENYLKQDPDSERSAQVQGFIEYLKK